MRPRLCCTWSALLVGQGPRNRRVKVRDLSVNLGAGRTTAPHLGKQGFDGGAPKVRSAAFGFPFSELSGDLVDLDQP
tara:strand:- start:540883 stop:541113 length:231 start_codon:yes stop_codon:yes gene_type:complete